MDDQAVPKETPPEADESKATQTRKWVSKLVATVAPAIVTAYLAYAGAGAETKDQAGQVKDKSEAGFQYIDKWVTYFKETDAVHVERIAKLEAEIAEIKRRARLSSAKRKAEAVVKSSPAPVAPVPAAPPPLPPNLDKALEQLQTSQAK